MKFEITVIKHDLILPGKEILCTCEDHSFFYLETTDPIELKWQKKHHFLVKKHVIIGNRFRLFNNSDKIVNVRGFRFKWGDNVNRPLIFKDYKDDSYITKLISNLFSKEVRMNEIITSIEEFFPRFYTEELNNTHSNKNQATQLTGKIDARLIIINRYIRKNYQKTITLQELSNIIKCNPTYLSNSYSKIFKISPMKYYINLKMEKAKELILYTSYSIKDIAKRLGYISSSQFSDMFKKYYNISPKKMRMNNIT